MNDADRKIFIKLFRECCLKGLGFPLESVLTETDSKLLSNKIFDSTGLVIGPKSLKNYSFYVLSDKSGVTRTENPSVATLDTLARFVLDAPHTDEVTRKDTEGHHPYWFSYRSGFSSGLTESKNHFSHLKKLVIFIIVVTCLAILIFLVNSFLANTNKVFNDNFDSVAADSLRIKGWIIKSIDTESWQKRNEKPGHLTLFTLRGDNWSDSENPAKIKNLLMRELNSDCFIVETHLSDFVPVQNWQQAGILLSEDSTFTGRMIRLSISYNDFFGGYKHLPEIIIQIVGSSPAGTQSKPEEIAHFSLQNIEPGQEQLVRNNLAKTALKIEKRNNHFRFLYAAGPIENFAFREVASADFNIRLRYVSIFAIQGWAQDINPIPACFDSFKSVGLSCRK
jgi:hypothetical protein